MCACVQCVYIACKAAGGWERERVDAFFCFVLEMTCFKDHT